MKYDALRNCFFPVNYVIQMLNAIFKSGNELNGIMSLYICI